MSLAKNRLRWHPDGSGSFDAAVFLATLHTVCQLVSPWPGGMVKLVELYRVVALLPGAEPHYSRAAFAQDLYLLDRHHVDAATRSGLTFRLDPGSTGARKRSNLLITTSAQGVELRYYGIEFPR